MTLKYIHLSSSQLLLLNKPYITSSYSGLLLQCFYLALFLDTTTFEVNVTACDVENSFIFDNDA